ncbi:MAG: ABC transporter ATP-binding protein [Actinomycetota bacterium]|nr:ABC transporter ATP-binding protein [Actinomycetota bacterium]
MELDRVSMEYATPGGVVRALEDVTFSVGQGESLAIVGPSGCGKSTLLGLLGALDVPTSGRIVIGDREISSMSERERTGLRREAFGFVFQSDNLHPFLTVLENVTLQLSLAGRENGDVRCRETLDQLGLAGEEDKLPDQLSGGQRQRVGVARALVHRPSLVLADEPTGSLDAENSAAVVDLLLAARKAMGTTIVMVTHDQRAGDRMDRTVALRDGRLVSNPLVAHAG